MAPNIGIPNVNAQNCFFLCIIQILRIIPKFADFIHHFAGKILLSGGKGNLQFWADRLNTCEECRQLVVLSNVSASGTVLVPVQRIHSVFSLVMLFHDCFRLISQKSKSDISEEAAKNIIDSKMSDVVVAIRNTLVALNAQAFGVNYGDPAEFINFILEILHQAEAYLRESLMNSFDGNTALIRNLNFIDQMFVNQGSAEQKCETCHIITKERFEYITQTYHVPAETDYSTSRNFILNRYANCLTKKIANIQCHCPFNVTQPMGDIKFDHFAEVQILILDRFNYHVDQVSNERSATISRLEVKIPKELKCFCNACMGGIGIHLYHLIGVVAYQIPDHYISYIRDTYYKSENCSMKRCCAYTASIEAVEQKPDVRFVRISSDFSEEIDIESMLKNLQGNTGDEHARILFYKSV